jgi:hypothetical protein
MSDLHLFHPYGFISEHSWQDRRWGNHPTYVQAKGGSLTWRQEANFDSQAWFASKPLWSWALSVTTALESGTWFHGQVILVTRVPLTISIPCQIHPLFIPVVNGIHKNGKEVSTLLMYTEKSISLVTLRVSEASCCVANASSEATMTFRAVPAAWAWYICCHPVTVIPHFWYIVHLDHGFWKYCIAHEVFPSALQNPPVKVHTHHKIPHATAEHTNNSKKLIEP